MLMILRVILFWITTSSYLYDALDRLITVVKNEEKYRYIYDSQNRRIVKQKYCKTFDDWNLEATTKFLYQDSCEVGSLEGDAFTSFRALGAGLGAEIGAAFALEIEGVVYAPAHNQSGSVIALVDAQTGDFVHAARYSAFGQVEKSHGLSPPYQFSSKRLDPETGWIYFGRRYYDSSLGRWTTCDPTGYSDGFNLYAYVHNNPLTHFDEYGLFDGYWDPTPEESAMFNAEAQLQGMKFGALQARDFFFGCTYELGNSLHSEFWGDPNDPNRVIPISQRSFTEIGLLAGGTAIELSAGKVIGVCGRGVKFLGKGALKIPYVRKTAQVAMRTFDALWKTRKAAKAVQKAKLPKTLRLNGLNSLPNFKYDFDSLSKAGKVPDRNGLTRAGRALDKHGSRKGSVFPKATGNSHAKNAQGQYHLDDILTNPNTTFLPNKFDGFDFFALNRKNA